MKARVLGAFPALLLPLLPALVLSGVLGACDREAIERFVVKPVTGGPIGLGELGSMTGDPAQRGVSAHLGLKLAIEEVNARGGVAGRMLRVHAFDDQGRAEAAARAVERFEDEEHPAALVALSRREIVDPAARRAKTIPIVALTLDGGKSGSCSKEFAQRFHARFGSEPDEAAEIAYDALQFVADALAQSKTFGGADVGAALSRSATERAATHRLSVRADAGSKLVLLAERAPR